MYSLVSAPVLGFDLARLPGGPAGAEVLSRALSLTPDDLGLLARELPDVGTRAESWRDVAIADECRRRIWDQVDTSGLRRAASTLAALEGSPVGTLEGLLRCVRRDVLDWTWRDGRQSPAAADATAVVCDAVVAGYLRDLLPVPTRRRLAAGWLAALRLLPARRVDLGPYHREAHALLTRVRRLDRATARRLAAAVDRTRSENLTWAAAVHSTAWAVHLSGRVRPAAAAQLALVQAVDAGGISIGERAAGTWNLLSGALQALLVRDLLDTATSNRLLAPYLAALGPARLS
jgi:hypothetical protein